MRKILIIVVLAGILLNSISAQEIFEAVKTNDLAKIKILTGNDPGLVSAKDCLGNTPLHTSAIAGSVPITEFLLSKGADINAGNNHLMTPLHEAIYNKQEAVALLLIEKGADLNRQDMAGNTPLHQTAYSNSATIAGLLISKGAGLEIRNRNNYTPLGALARSTHNFEVAEILVKGGANVNARWTNDGRSAYNIAEAADNGEVMELFKNLGADTCPQQFPVITGPYLGQIPPGKEMKRFAPGIVYLDHTTISVSPDGNEMYWGNGYSILYSAIRDGQWTRPVYPSFSGPNDLMFYDDVPFVSPDNKRLFFTSRRPVITLSANTNKENIWYVERTATGWSDPRPAGAAVNAMSLHWQVTVSRNGTLWFGGSDQNSFGAGDIYYSRLVNGEYTQPVNAGPVINTGESEMMPFIAPDESYLFFFRAILQRPYLFISFKGDDGQWQEPIPIDRFPVYVGVMVSPDGKYLFTYNQWVSADFIGEMRPEK